MTTRVFGKLGRTFIVSAALVAALLGPAAGGVANAAESPPTDASCGFYDDGLYFHFNNCAPQNGRLVMVKYVVFPNSECVPPRTDWKWMKKYVSSVTPTDRTCDPKAR